MAFETPLETAARIEAEHRARRQFQPLPAERIGDLGYAYEVQDAVVTHRLERLHDTIAGWKIGLTTKRMQTLCGIDVPIAGAVLASTIHRSPATLKASGYIKLGIEMELAVRLGRRLPAGPTAATVRDCLDGVSAAFEVVDDRGADYSRLDACSLIADNSWNAEIVVGEARMPEGSLLGRHGVLTAGDQELGRGKTEDAGGDPLEVVAWLAKKLRERGRELEPGQWVMTGSIIATRHVGPGESYRFEIDGLPAVEVRIV